MEIQERIAKKRSFMNTMRHIPERISEGVERFFYALGSRIALQPQRWLIGSVIIIIFCLSGLYWFRQEKNPLKLWIPPNSDFVHDTEWFLSNFGEGQRVQNIILTGDDILQAEILVKLNEIIKQVVLTKVPGIHAPISWTDVCFKIPSIKGHIRNRRSTNYLDNEFFEEEPSLDLNEIVFEPAVHADSGLYCSIYDSLPRACFMYNILDLWEYDSNKINNQTKEDIIMRINTVKVSPTLGHPMNFTDLLGDVTRDHDGRIVSAKALKTQFMVRVNFSNINMDTSGNDAGTADWATEEALRWESGFLLTLKKASIELQNWNNNHYRNETLGLFYEAGRSFGDISSSTLFQDIDKLAIGILLMFFYVQLILSNFNWVEWRFCLTVTGLLCVGGAFIISIGVCSAIGIPYGPVHTSLPFMLLGLGIDDLFVMMASWKQIHSLEENRKKALHERIGLALGHAGSAICITSFTDVVAFIIGASTILPSLQSFCIYAAVGVLVTFLLQITFFVAFFTLDAKRIQQKRNGLIPCIVHENYVSKIVDPNETFSTKLIDRFYSKIVLTVPGKLSILLITIIAASVGAIGSYQLEQWFDPIWFLPKDSHLSNYIVARNQYFSHRGHSAYVFIGDIDYPSEFSKIMTLASNLKNLSSVEKVDSWPEDFAHFVQTFYQADLTTNKIKKEDFQRYLSKFLFSRMGGKYQMNFHFDGKLKCGEDAPRILIATMEFFFIKFTGPHQWIPAMDDTKQIARETGINGFVTVWSKVFSTWVTDKLIAQEVLRNIILALICVMGTTAVLIAEPQTCFWILLCVLLTLLNVCGFMYFWGLTIDIVSCIGLELAVGLSVDYAAHVAHAFLNASSKENNNQDRKIRALIAVKHIGAAVAYGAGSTLLALSMLAFSDAYVFRAFFKIFFLVILFGLWHGLLLLPIVLSTVGPRSLRHNDKRRSNDSDATRVMDEEADKPLNTETEN
ncbi:PREDICTED: patched domain-containing protein 3-like [Polistes dominula]|uniref:Patched domain-containing protein 3-like n=1 Tax=Polistes dominula TaxID=743375 RepID=A0ABM1J7S7_POLDO|nr:PREDICTED: patched domain-containing protein 3-like [Polistes dominula]XP_015188515.1 PREDICTED: patched domain-containing protein 3-like [Polistes dominula]XP_015188525.1 PREDICTED: patched domain-containing protein 3-like [Polistes dominula]XP_015188535.1 PREDICTED: patched domain-containing protein 3-like [Polistes dominula]XP_015188544.1 PREDICTED: patched domain-containing protein 3-like [Polistes dominula]